MDNIQLNSIEEAVNDFREGKFVIVVDDEDRENEGDLICAAECITAEMVNFMLKNARGLLCAPITKERCEDLDLPHQVVETHLNTTDIRAAGTCESPLCPGQWRTAAFRTYGGCHRPLPPGRPLPCRSPDGNHE